METYLYDISGAIRLDRKIRIRETLDKNIVEAYFLK